VTWANDVQIFGAWTLPGGIQPDTNSYVTSPNHRDKIIEIDGTRRLLQSVTVGLGSEVCGRCRNDRNQLKAVTAGCP